MNNGIEAVGLGYRKESPHENRIVELGAAVTGLTSMADQLISAAETVA